MTISRSILAGLTGPWMLLFASPVTAQEPHSWTLQQAIGDPDDFHISGSARVRYEAVDGQFRPGLADSDGIVMLRTSLFVEYRPGPVSVGFELVDSRAFGTRPDGYVTTTEVNALEPIQAYIAFNLGKALGAATDTRLTAGRFTLPLGSGRLVARNNFRNTTNAFFGLRADLAASDSRRKLVLFYTLPLQRLPDDKPSLLENTAEIDRASFDLAFWGAHATVPVSRLDLTVEAYLYGLEESDTPRIATRDRSLLTPGIRLSRKPKTNEIDFDLEGALQFGRSNTSAAAGALRQDVAAGFAHAEVGFRFAGRWAPRVALLYDFGSGDRAGGKQTRFDSLYGARRSDLGNTSLFGALSRSNLSSPGARLEVQPPGGWKAALLYRAAWLDSSTDSFAATGVRDAAGAAGRFGGHIVDARVSYDVIPRALTIETGASLLVTGRFLDTAPNRSGNGDSRYGFVQLTATF